MAQEFLKKRLFNDKIIMESGDHMEDIKNKLESLDTKELIELYKSITEYISYLESSKVVEEEPNEWV